MKKNFFQSKTLWGFGLLAVALAGQQLGVLGESTLVELFKTAFGFFGVYGLRDALK